MLKLNKILLQYSLLSLSLMLSLVFSSFAYANEMQNKVQNFSFMGNYFNAHPVTQKIFLPFIEKVRKDLKGKVIFEYYENTELYSENKAYSALNEDNVNIGAIRPSLFPNEMKLTNIINLPNMSNNPIMGALLLSDIIDKFPEISAELPKNSLAFTEWTSGAFQLHPVNAIKNIDELKDKKIIVWDTISYEAIKKLGAKPIPLPSTETYYFLSENKVDGVLCPIAPLRGFNLTEIVKHHLILNMKVDAFIMPVSKSTWSAFTKEQQDYLKKEAADKPMKIAKTLIDSVVNEVELLKKEGHTFYVPSEKEKEKIDEKFTAFSTDWLKKMEQAGYKNANEILEYTKERREFYKTEFRNGTYGEYTSIH